MFARTLIHPSSIGKIMPDAKIIDHDLLNDYDLDRIGACSLAVVTDAMSKKTKGDAEKLILAPMWECTLSAGAKTYLKSIAKQISYDYEIDTDVKAFAKGLACENDAIDLVNSLHFKNYKKHDVRVETDLLTGECDILAPTYVRDIKCAWSIATFPAFKEDAHTSDYEYQLRAYMHLYDRPKAYLDWCLVDTPDELIRYEDVKLHKVGHIDECMRVTTVEYIRDMEIERKMLIKCREAQLFIERMKKQILIDHNY